MRLAYFPMCFSTHSTSCTHKKTFQWLFRISSCVKPFKFYLMCMRKHYKHTIIIIYAIYIYGSHEKWYDRKKKTECFNYHILQWKSREVANIHTCMLLNGNFWCGFLLLCRFSSFNLLLFLLLFRSIYFYSKTTFTQQLSGYIKCFLCILNINRFYISWWFYLHNGLVVG